MAKPFEIAPGGAFAYRPEELIVRRGDLKRAQRAFDRIGRTPGPPPTGVGPKDKRGNSRFDRFTEVRDPLGTQERLRADGVEAQVNHVLFATGCCCGGSSKGSCPPHPSLPGAEDFYAAHPFYANPFYANPFYANPFYANPFYANPFYANPFYANEGGCGCGRASANPFYANPFYANPFYANPFYANAERNPGAPSKTASGVRRSSAIALDAEPQLPQGNSKMDIAVVDTGYATDNFAPTAAGFSYVPNHPDKNDEPNLDPVDQYLDPVAGHGTFIAGVIERQAPGSRYRVSKVLSGQGDGDEVKIAEELETIADLAGNRPQFVNLSFAGYSPLGMGVLADAVAELQSTGVIVVASAGNDATCAPAYPAALPGVISVAALDGEPDADTGHAEAATFTNYGPWVNAAAPGVDIESVFFRNWQDDRGDFKGGARWSGTSFAAPHVVGVLANRANEIWEDRQNNGAADRWDAARMAVNELIDENEFRKPMLGAIIGSVPGP